MTKQQNDTMHSQPLNKRPIRSFVLRQGRLTKGQQQALDDLLPKWGVDYNFSQKIDFAELFKNSNPVTLEIGFGMGQSFVEMAKNSPNENYLGIEVHQPGVGACLMVVGQEALTNVRVMCHDAVEIISHMLPDNSLNKVQIFFPDPWHKARHNKRRIIQPEFLQLLRTKLTLEGILHLATDWQDYAEHMKETINQASGFENLSLTGDYIPRPDERPLTKFEQRGLNLGHGVWDLKAKRIS